MLTLISFLALRVNKFRLEDSVSVRKQRYDEYSKIKREKKNLAIPVVRFK